jgi:hypothetical protein
MIMVVLSASSGFLVQAIFNKDIQSELRNENKARVEQKRLEVLAPIKARISELRASVAKKNEELKEEVQGQSPTQKKNCGDACHVLQNQLAALSDELVSKEAQAAEIEKIFERSTVAELQSRYGVVLLGDGIETRGQILEKIGRNNYTFRTTEWTIRGLLGVLFIGLLLLKLFQPTSVGIYYCAVLQGLYAEYLAGHLNRWLAPEDCPDRPSGGMKPHAFAEWAIRVYGPRKTLDEFRLRLKALEAGHTAGIEVLDQHLSSLESELRTLNNRGIGAAKEETAIGTRITEQHSMTITLAASIDDLERERTGLQTGLGSRDIPVKAYSRILERLAVLDGELARRTTEKTLAGSTEESLRRQRSEASIEKATLTDQISARRKEVILLRDERARRIGEYLRAVNVLTSNYDSPQSTASVEKVESQAPPEPEVQPVSATVQ